jgi:TPR repeat protein
MNSTAGYVYILINPSLNGIVKIGKTQNNPEERAKELSSATGVPTPFFVAYSSYFTDCTAAEIFVHTRLANNRLAQNKEFFQVSVQQAIEAVREAESNLRLTPESTTNDALKSGETSTTPLAPWKVIFNSANAYVSGLDDTIQDESEAFKLYIKSAKLGSISAYWIIGRMYRHGRGCSEDHQKAKDAFLEGIKLGNSLCWAGLAEIYFLEEHKDNWDKCWKKYFNSPFFREEKIFEEFQGEARLVSLKNWQLCIYVLQSATRGWEMSQRELMYENRADIFTLIVWYQGATGDDELFKPVEEAMALIQRVEGAKLKSTPSLPLVADEDFKNKSAVEMFQMANTLYHNDVNEDNIRKGIFLYEKAALAGFKLAYWQVGRIYSVGYYIEADKEKAIKFLKQGIELGVDLCWTELAYIFAQDKIFDKWNSCWKRYFESKTFQNNVIFNDLVEFDKLKSNREYQMFFYIQQASENQWKIPFMSVVAKHRQKITELILRNTNSIRSGEIPVKDIVQISNVFDQGNVMSVEDYCQAMLSQIPII